MGAISTSYRSRLYSEVDAPARHDTSKPSERGTTRRSVGGFGARLRSGPRRSRFRRRHAPAMTHESDPRSAKWRSSGSTPKHASAERRSS